jgi:hypothetical protein
LTVAHRLFGTVLGGLVISLILAGCEPSTPAAGAKSSIVGEWEVVEYVAPGVPGNLADQHDMSLAFTEEGRYVWTFDPPLPGASEAGAVAMASGAYELLDDTRMLLLAEIPAEARGVMEYSVTATVLRLESETGAVTTARRK